MKRQHIVLKSSMASCLLSLSSASFLTAGTVIIQPNKDTSIYSESNNSNATGSLFAGEVSVTSNYALRRALVQFDVAGNVPAGATIDSVTVSLFLTQNGPAGDALFELHPLLSAWGVGTSSGSGAGGPPTSGDATWTYRLFSSNSWGTPGGDFGATSGTTTIGSSPGTTYTFSSQPGMVTNVQNWLGNPGSNFGWILKVANETPGIVSAKVLASSEALVSDRPTLTVNFTPAPEPGSFGLVVAGVGMLIGRRNRKD